MGDRYDVAVIVASVRPERIGPKVARWFLQWLEPHTDAVVDYIDLAELHLPSDLAGGGDAECFAKRIEQADAVVVITPEYNHGYPGPLKTAIDTAYEQWWAKPVGFVSYGGSAGGIRAADQLRAVFAELHVVTMQTGVQIQHAYDAFDEHGDLCNREQAAGAAGAMLRQLSWWARSLRQARHERPYVSSIAA